MPVNQKNQTAPVKPVESTGTDPGTASATKFFSIRFWLVLLLILGLAGTASSLIENFAKAGEINDTAPSVAAFFFTCLGGLLLYALSFLRKKFSTKDQTISLYFVLVACLPLFGLAFWFACLLLLLTPMRKAWTDDYYQHTEIEAAIPRSLLPYGPNLIAIPGIVERADDNGSTLTSTKAEGEGGVIAAIWKAKRSRSVKEPGILTGRNYTFCTDAKVENMAPGASTLQIEYSYDGKEWQVAKRHVGNSKRSPRRLDGYQRMVAYMIPTYEMQEELWIAFRLRGVGTVAFEDPELRDNEAAFRFFEGARVLAAGESGYEGLPRQPQLGDWDEHFWRATRLVPWELWLGPFVRWIVLAFLMFLMMLSLMVIFRRQWGDYERVGFPMVRLIRSYFDRDAEGKLIYQKPLFWTGFIIAAGLIGYRGLRFSYPSLPELKLEFNLNTFFSAYPFDALGKELKFIPFIVGIGFLLTSEISFSIWAFVWIMALVTVLGRLFFDVETLKRMYVHDFPHQDLLTLGGYFGFFLISIFAARKHLLHVFKRLLGAPAKPDEILEGMSYPVALLVLASSFAGAVFWGLKHGFQLQGALVFFGCLFVFAIAAGRVRADTGWPGPSIFPFHWWALFFALGGFAVFGFSSLVMVMILYFFTFGYFFFQAPAFIDGLQSSYQSRVSTRQLSAAWTVAFLVTLVVGAGATMILYASSGSSELHFNSKFGDAVGTYGGLEFAFNEQVTHLNKNTSAGLSGEVIAGKPLTHWLTAIGVGAGIVCVLSFARMRLAGFPLHPIGFLLIGTENRGAQKVWFSIFVAWFLRLLITRVGGIRSVQRATPLFIGLVLGTLFIALCFTTIGGINKLLWDQGGYVDWKMFL